MSILDSTYQYSNIVWTFPPPITFTAIYTHLKKTLTEIYWRSSSSAKKSIKPMTISSLCKLHKFINCTYLSIRDNFSKTCKLLNPYTPRVKALLHNLNLYDHIRDPSLWPFIWSHWAKIYDVLFDICFQYSCGMKFESLLFSARMLWEWQGSPFQPQQWLIPSLHLVTLKQDPSRRENA